jgi:hypothetical protein
MKNKFGYCPKCVYSISKRKNDDRGISCLELIGCEELTKEQWEDGLPTDIDKFWNQKNCPLTKEIK